MGNRDAKIAVVHPECRPEVIVLASAQDFDQSRGLSLQSRFLGLK